MSSFFAELKRRNVYKVAVAYAVVAWLLIQIATQVFPFFEIPNWAVRLVVLLLVLGFPVALVLAWAFEVTPEGIKRTPAEAQETGRSPRRRLTWIYVVLVAAALSVGIFLFTRSSVPSAPSHSSSEPKDKSIAVLPFQNLSSDAQNAFFAQGIQDEIITTLSKISGLRVISRTSTARYQSAPENLPSIARELGVSNVLEGSVQKVSDRVHINVQLIQAENEGHLWAQSYDRQLTDIFGVEAEVAKSIADSLSATLSPQEMARVETRPTSNAEAYVLYLRGREYQTRPDTLLQDSMNAERYYQQAIALDPNFALAHARLSAVESIIFHWFEPTQARSDRAREEARVALRLQPNLGEGHLALALSYYYAGENYEAALQELEIAEAALPNNGEVILYIAAIRRRQGHMRESLAIYERARKVDPRNPVVLEDLSQSLFLLRDWKATADALDRVLEFSPDSVAIRIQRAYVDFLGTGNTAPIKATLTAMPVNVDPDGQVSFPRWDVSLIDRDAAGAMKALAATPLETITTADGSPVPKVYLQACAELLQADETRARADFERARPTMEQTVANSPNDAFRRAHLGLLYAFLGRKEDALREGRRAVELKPVARDAVDGSSAEAFLCLIYARLGMADEAISLIERMLARPGGVNYSSDSITLQDLRHRWEWDRVRNDPRFQKIISGPEPKPVYQ